MCEVFRWIAKDSKQLISLGGYTKLKSQFRLLKLSPLEPNLWIATGSNKLMLQRLTYYKSNRSLKSHSQLRWCKNRTCSTVQYKTSLKFRIAWTKSTKLNSIQWWLSTEFIKFKDNLEVYVHHHLNKLSKFSSQHLHITYLRYFEDWIQNLNIKNWSNHKHYNLYSQLKYRYLSEYLTSLCVTWSVAKMKRSRRQYFGI